MVQKSAGCYPVIPIQNIYYMLAYAFQALTPQGSRYVSAETFANTADLFAAILIRGISVQIKRGLTQEYISRTEPLATPKGQLNLTESVKTKSILRQRLVCTYDEFSINCKINQILKSTILLLMKANISKERRRAMRKLLIYFAEVDTIPLSGVNWHMRFHRNNQSYRLLMGVCYLTAKGLLQSGQDGSVRVMDYLDEQRMCRLYEKFILEFYRREYPQLSASASKIDWQLDDGMGDLLPEMRSDITLAQGNRVLIIDAKYYANILQMQFDVPKIHSGNLYQIFTYVKNKEAELANIPHDVSGMLLYAKTDAEVLPNQQYHMSGNRIAVQTLDLDCDFSQIVRQLGEIVEEYFLK